MPEQKARFRDALFALVFGTFAAAVMLWSTELISQRPAGALIALAGGLAILFRARLGSSPAHTLPFRTPLQFGPFGYLLWGAGLLAGGLAMVWDV